MPAVHPGLQHPATTAAWQRIDSTYLACADGLSTDSQLQRAHADRATPIDEIPTSHNTFVSRPDLVAETMRAVLVRIG